MMTFDDLLRNKMVENEGKCGKIIGNHWKKI